MIKDLSIDEKKAKHTFRDFIISQQRRIVLVLEQRLRMDGAWGNECHEAFCKKKGRAASSASASSHLQKLRSGSVVA